MEKEEIKQNNATKNDESKEEKDAPASHLPPHLISKEHFVDLLNFMKNQGDRFMKLCDIAETLSPGNYVNFWPHFEYDTRIIDLLNFIFGYEDDSSSMISYFCIDLNFGREPIAKELSYNGEKLDLSTPENLYDFCLKTYK